MSSDRRIVVRDGAGLLAVDVIPSEAEAVAQADAEDLSAVVGFAAGRRTERLAWRRVLREVLEEHFGCTFPHGLRIEYSAAGAPSLKDFPSLNISVSHCRDMVAVAVSHVGPTVGSGLCRGACGVDIERADRNFERAASRYITAEERTLSSDPRLPAAVWCAKECLFKMRGRKGLDLLRDIAVTRIDFAAGIVSGRVAGDAAIDMRMFFPDENHLVVFHI